MTASQAARPGLDRDDLQDRVLHELREAVNYRRWVAGLIAPHLGEDPLEVGSGTGDYAAEWAAGGQRLTASEADPRRLAALRRRFADHPRVTVRELAAPIRETAHHSAVVAVNVLEHIADDVGALATFAGLVRPGGKVVIFVPAFPVAMSAFDRAIGHHRRYRRGPLAATARAGGLAVEDLRHVNAPGLPAWILLMRLLGRRPQAGPALVAFDRLVVPVARRLEALVAPPFGQSLLLVARRP